MSRSQPLTSLAAPHERGKTTRRTDRFELSRFDRTRAAVCSTALLLPLAVCGSSMRLRIRNQRVLTRCRTAGAGNVIFALWHGDFFPAVHYARHSATSIIVSRSADGEILARMLRWLGYRTVRGSTRRGGSKALIEIARDLSDGRDAAIAVDGPRGPAEHVKLGVILLAGLSGRPIIPIAAGVIRCKQFASWDRFRLPLPFARVVLAAGEPIRVPADAQRSAMDGARREVEDALRNLRVEANADVQSTQRFSRLDRPLGLRALARDSSSGP